MQGRTRRLLLTLPLLTGWIRWDCRHHPFVPRGSVSPRRTSPPPHLESSPAHHRTRLNGGLQLAWVDLLSHRRREPVGRSSLSRPRGRCPQGPQAALTSFFNQRASVSHRGTALNYFRRFWEGRTVPDRNCGTPLACRQPPEEAGGGFEPPTSGS